MKVTGTEGIVTIETDEFFYEVELQITAFVRYRTVEIASLEIFNSGKLNDNDYEGPYPPIDEDALCLELKNMVDWFEKEQDELEYLQELNSEY